MKLRIRKETIFKTFDALDHSSVKRWFRDSIQNWISGAGIDSFGPFTDWFPSYEDEHKSLAILVLSLEITAVSQKLDASRSLFRHALADLLAETDIFENNIPAFRFILQVCSELKTTELVQPLTRLVGSPKFKLAEDNSDYDLFGDVIDAINCVGLSTEVKDFFEAAKIYCQYRPLYTPDVLLQLCTLDKNNAAKHIWDLRISLNMYRSNAIERRGLLFTQEIDRFKKKLAALLPDHLYRETALQILKKNTPSTNNGNLGWLWLEDKIIHYSETEVMTMDTPLNNELLRLSGGLRQNVVTYYNRVNTQ